MEKKKEQMEAISMESQEHAKVSWSIQVSRELSH